MAKIILTYTLSFENLINYIVFTTTISCQKYDIDVKKRKIVQKQEYTACKKKLSKREMALYLKLIRLLRQCSDLFSNASKFSSKMIRNFC